MSHINFSQPIQAQSEHTFSVTQGELLWSGENLNLTFFLAKEQWGKVFEGKFILWVGKEKAKTWGGML